MVDIWNAGTVVSSSMQKTSKEYQDERKSRSSSSSWVVSVLITSGVYSDISYIFLSGKSSFFA